MKCGNSILTEWCFRVRYFLPRTTRLLFLCQQIARKNANRSWSTNPSLGPAPTPDTYFQPTNSAEEPCVSWFKIRLSTGPRFLYGLNLASSPLCALFIALGEQSMVKSTDCRSAGRSAECRLVSREVTRWVFWLEIVRSFGSMACSDRFQS